MLHCVLKRKGESINMQESTLESLFSRLNFLSPPVAVPKAGVVHLM